MFENIYENTCCLKIRKILTSVLRKLVKNLVKENFDITFMKKKYIYIKILIIFFSIKFFSTEFLSNVLSTFNPKNYRAILFHHQSVLSQEQRDKTQKSKFPFTSYDPSFIVPLKCLWYNENVGKTKLMHIAWWSGV